MFYENIVKTHFQEVFVTSYFSTDFCGYLLALFNYLIDIRSTLWRLTTVDLLVQVLKSQPRIKHDRVCVTVYNFITFTLRYIYSVSELDSTLVWNRRCDLRTEESASSIT